MIEIKSFTFGPFAENTYVLSDEDGNALIIDPGMYYPQENVQLFEYLQAENLTPTSLLLTHAHLDHVFGVNFINESFNLTPQLHQDDDFIYKSAVATANHYGLSMNPLPEVNLSLMAGNKIAFGGCELELLLAPGHSPGSICFYCKEQNFVIGGDVLFQGSIGRTDLPGGDYSTLINSINSQLMPLADETVVYSGHGPITTIGQERISNPFLNQ